MDGVETKAETKGKMPKYIQTTVLLDIELYETLEDFANKIGAHKSQVIRWALVEYLQKRGYKLERAGGP